MSFKGNPILGDKSYGKNKKKFKKIDSNIESVRIKAMERLAAMQDKDSRERDFKIADVIKDVVSKEPKQKKENDDA